MRARGTGSGQRAGGHELHTLGGAAPLDHDERHAVCHERGGDHGRVVEVLLHPVVQRQADRRGGDAAQHDLAPELPGIAPAVLALRGAERIQLVEKQHADSQDGTELDNHEVHIDEGGVARRVGVHAHLHELVHQDHMARGRDRQPLRDALDDAQQHRFQQFDDIQGELPCPQGARTPARSVRSL